MEPSCLKCGKPHSSGSHAKGNMLGGHQHWFEWPIARLPAAHPHEHTTHALRDVIEALPRYAPRPYGRAAMDLTSDKSGDWLALADVRAVVHKAATLGAPVSHDKEERI